MVVHVIVSCEESTDSTVKIRWRGSLAQAFSDILRCRGRGSTTFFVFFDGWVVVLQVLRRSSVEESWVDNVLWWRGSLPMGFFARGFFVGRVL
ncbi:wall-associated receptor kinase 2-like [Cucumis melo var. makuwa]|uniref:Wall-associated receptor kinase 2-like n=1 Tax=Cucumis melo var. makuwa TaxID=1194695 RepID=A0A5A7TJ26_CUCMM|nr:wall-associated receptor kinase 2-like [Cucumis melo var. makuwa]